MSSRRPSQMSPDLLASLRAAIAEGSTVRTVSNGAPNLVTSIEPSGVWIETDRTRAHGEGAKLVPAWMLQLAWTELRSRGKLSADFLREREVRRSSAVLALLAALPGVGVVSTRPIELALIDSSSGRTPEERVVPPDDDALTVSGRWSARSAGPRVGLVGCVKSKQPRRARAADLYTSALFRGRRSFVESTCDRWFILSAEHGLLSPDSEIEPYDVTLTTAAPAERRAWSRRVLASLERELGLLDGVVFEVHAGAAYRDHGLLDGLRSRGAAVEVPARGLGQGEQLAFYAQARRTDAPPARSDPDALVDRLLDPSYREPANRFPREPAIADHPGLYAWWADDDGLAQLSRAAGAALGQPIYAGQAGASAKLAGTEREATLASRVRGGHLGGNSSGSTFRRTLGALLFEVLSLEVRAPKRLTPGSEAALTEWMRRHLSVTIAPVDDRRSLAHVEEQVLARLDPPLNLMGMRGTPVRSRLRRLRRRLDATIASAEEEPSS